MTDFFKQHKKKTIFVTFLFLLFFGGWWTVEYNLPKTVEVVVKLFLGPTFKSSSIDFEKNRIVVKDFVLADGDEIIIDTPQVDILYSKESLKKMRIEEIVVNGGTANITRRKNGDINIVAAFTGSSEGKTTENAKVKKEKPYEPGIAIPIDKITGKNVTTVYRDLGYRLPIEQVAYNTNGYLTFSKTEGIDLHFVGNNQEEIYDFAFSTAKEPYSMTIKLSNIGVKTELVQYGYDGKEVSYEGGKLDMDLTIASSGMLGWIKFDDVDVRYIDLDDTIKNAKGRVDFKPEGIFLTAQALVFDKPEKFSLSYKDNELNIDFDLANIEKKNLEKLSYLKGIDLPFEKLNVDSVKFNLNMKKELKINIDASIKKAEMKSMELVGTEIKLLYDKDGIHLPTIKTTLNLLDEKGKKNLVEGIDGKFNFWEGKGDLTLSIKNLNGKNFIPEFDGKLDFQILEKEIRLSLDSNIIDLKGKYLTEEKKFQLDKENEYFLEYDLNSKKLTKGNGEIKFSLFSNNFLLNYSVYNNGINLKSFSLVGEKRKELDISGEINLDTLVYDLNLKSENLYLKELLGEKNGELRGNFTGNIVGERDRFNGEININSVSAKYFGNFENLKGKLEFSKEKNLFLEFNGEIGKISYNDYSLSGLYLVARLKDNIFEIKNLNNQLLNIFGTLNLSKETVDVQAQIHDLSLKKFGVENPEIKINNIVGKLQGKLNNPKGNLLLEDVKVILENGEEIAVNGEASYSNNMLVVDRLKVNNNILKGNYSLKTHKYSATINLIEENLGRYYDNSSLNYRVIGKVKIQGQEKNITTTLKSTIDKVYISGNRLPNIYMEGEYKAKDLTDGIVNIKEITLSNQKLENLITITGNYDIINSSLDTRIKKQTLPLKKLQEYIPIENLEGDLVLEGDFGGKIDDLSYYLNVTSNNLGVKNIIFNNLKLFLSGNLEKISLDEFSFKYLDNLFYSRGDYDILNSKYLYEAEAKDINLDFLNIFLEPYKINNIKGFSTFNIKIQEDGNSGFLKVRNLNLENKDFFLKLEEFNSTIRLEKNNLFIEKFQGKLNDGKMSLTGELDIPLLEEITENPYYKESLKYKLNLKLDNVKYRYGNMFKIDFNTDISVADNLIFGNIEIVDGKVEEIPNTSKSIFQKIKEFLFKSSSETVNQSEDLGSDFKINTVFENSLEINLGVKIRDGIKLDIQTLNSFVGDIKGNVLGNGTLSGTGGKYSFIGNVEVAGGSLNVNENIFYLDRALIIFNDQKTYLPKVNPNLLIDAKVDVQDEQLGLSLNGNLDNLKFTISSKNGSSSGNLNSLLTDTDNLEGGSEATTTLITNVIGGQLTQILKPVSNLIKNTLNISKFRISSNLLTEQNKNGNSNEQTQSRLKLGAVLEAEDNIYKDKIWWVAKGTLLEDDSTENERISSNSGALREYDFSLEYRFNTTKSIGIGVGKLPEDRKKSSDKESKEGLNYHIDFKFEKKYDNLIDIFINK